MPCISLESFFSYFVILVIFKPILFSIASILWVLNVGLQKNNNCNLYSEVGNYIILGNRLKYLTTL